MKKQPAVIFGSRLRALAHSTGATQVVLSKTFHVSQASVSKWFNGSVPKPDLLPKIASYFGVSVDHLLGEDVELAAVISPSTPVVISSFSTELSGQDSWPKENVSISESDRDVRLREALRRAIEALQEAEAILGEGAVEPSGVSHEGAKARRKGK